MGIKKMIKAFFLREKRSSDAYIRYLRKLGIRIGEGCTIYDPVSVRIDPQNPAMLEIGNYVRITAGVQILTHDYSFSVLTAVCGDIVGSVGKTVLGNNIFIGRNALILSGVTIDDNVIIGAGSVVTKNCESGWVYGGVPAGKICTIEEMYSRRKSMEKENARILAQTYYEKNGRLPDESVMREYLMLFTPRRLPVPAELEKLMRDSGNYELCREYFLSQEAEFDGLEDFLRWCGLVQ